METVSNVVSAAAAAIWSKNDSETATKPDETATQHNETAGQEPVSGEKGAGSADEPFDKGNDDTATPTTNPTSTSSNPTSSSSNPTTASSDYTSSTDAPSHQHESTGRPEEEPASTEPPATDSKTTARESKTVNPESTKALTSNDSNPLVERGELPHGHGVKSVIEHEGTATEETESGAKSGDLPGSKLGNEKPATAHLSETPAGSSSDPTDSKAALSSAKEGKPSKMEKLKEKLHIGHKGEKNL